MTEEKEYIAIKVETVINYFTQADHKTTLVVAVDTKRLAVKIANILRQLNYKCSIDVFGTYGATIKVCKKTAEV